MTATATATANVTTDESIFLQVLKRQLHASPTNPRSEFPEGTIEEMRASIEKHGIIQPLIVRPWPEKARGGEPGYEIVCGERRFRGASRVEALERIPVMVRTLTDTQVREIQIIENLQREDVSPYDEAVGYAALLALKGEDGGELYTVDRIAEKIGKSSGYVKNRLKMQRTPKCLLEALKRGEVGTRVCEMVGRIPHAEDRERCAREVLEPQLDDRPMTAEEAQEHIREHFMVPLRRAPFDVASADLLPKAGSCEGCPFRTGNDPDLAAEIATATAGAKGKGGRTSGIDGNVCQNPKCFRDKCEAHLARVKAEAPQLVLSEGEAKSLYNDYGVILHNSRLQVATTKPGVHHVGHYDDKKLKPWGEYARQLGVPVRLAKNPRTGMVEELVDVEAVKAAERHSAPEKPVFLQKGASKGGDEKQAQLKEKRRREEEAEEIRMAFDRVTDVLVGNFSRAELLMMLGQAVDHQGIDVLLRWMEIQPGPAPKGSEFQSARAHKVAAIVDRVSRDGERYDREAILILVLMAQFAEAVSYQGIEAKRFAEFAKIRGVDLKEVKAAAKARVKERRAAAKAGKTKASPEGPGAVEPVAEGVEAAEEALDKTVRMMGAFRVNENNVVLNPEEVELVNVKGCVAIARLALIDNVWYSGYELKTKSSGSSGPVIYRPEEGYGHELRSEALAWEADNARAFFEHEERGGMKVPPAVYTSLKFLIDGFEKVPVEETDPTMQLQEDVRLVVEHFGRIAGTASVDTVKITQQLGLPMDRAVGVINELRGRRMIVMGCLDRDSTGVKEIMATAPKATEEVSTPRKSRLLAAAERKAGGGPKTGAASEAWLAHPALEKREKLLVKMEGQLGMWGPETIFDAVWVKAWVKGVKDEDLAWDLLQEAVHRGLIEADQVVMRPE